jgi:3-methyladenine DNA glycosylase AlkC
MFDYDANIRVNINDTAALAALKKLEDKIAQLSDPRTAGALKNLIGSSQAKGEFRALKQERAEDFAYRKRKARQIEYELRLSNALELQEGRRIKLQRAGALDVASRKKAIAKLDKIAAANPKNAEIQERVATGLARILTTQNEINRATNKNIGQKQRIADYNKQIDRLRELGATEGQLRKIQKRKYEFIDAAERRQTSLSDRRELQLKREIKLVGDAQKAARDAATAVTRPGTLSGGARLALDSGPARSKLGSPKADEARFKFYEKEYNKALAEVAKTEQAYEKQLQTNNLNNIKAEEAAKLASINRIAAAERAQNKRINDEVKENDRLQRAKEAGITASAKAGGPISALDSGPARSKLGSPKADEARFKFYEKEYNKALAEVAKTEQAYEKQLQTNNLNNIKAEEAAKLASINRIAAAERAQNKRINDEVKENDRLQRAKEAGITASAKAGGPISALDSGPARSKLGSPKADEARFKFYEKEYNKALAEVAKTEQAYEKQLQTNNLNNIKAEEAAKLASINRIAAAERAQNKRINDEVKENDRLQRAKEAGITATESAGLKLRALAKSADSIINKADRVTGSKGVTGPLALPDSKTLGAAVRGIQRIETSSEETQRFAERTAQALKRSEERSKSILEANEASVKAGKANAAEAAKGAKSAKSTELATRNTTKNVKAGTEANKAATAGKKGQGLLGFGQTATNLSAGAGFPLLFGGGPGSVLGGLGGALLGGFGGSIIFGALGQQLDALGAAALSTADAIGGLGSTASDLIPKLGSGAGNGFGGRAQALIDEGSSAQVATILRERFEEVYGSQALKDFQKLAETNKKFKETWQELGVQLQLLIDGPLEGLLGILNRINLKAKKDEELTPQELKVRKLEQRNRSFGPTITQANIDELNQAKADLPKTTTEKEETSDTKAEKKLIDLVKEKKAIEEQVNADKLAALSQALTARRDELAILNTAAGITRAAATLDNTRKELTAERLNAIKDIYRITQLEKDEAAQAAELERQKVAQANALAIAQLQIYKDEKNALIDRYRVEDEIYGLQLKLQALAQDAIGQYDTELIAIRAEAKSQEDVLRAKFELRKLDIKELEVKIQEAILLETKVDKIKQELALKEKQLQQAETLRRIGIDQYNQQQKLNTLLAEQNALRSIQANNPERTVGFASAGLGFFGDSAKLEADLFQKYNDDIDVFNRKIADAEQNLERLTPAEINDGRADPFQKELDTVEVLKSNYERLQPAINAAALEQQRFNDALAAVTRRPSKRKHALHRGRTWA